MSQPWLKELNGDSMKVGYRGCFLFSLFILCLKYPSPFFFAFEVRFVYYRKSDHCESLCFVIKALFTRTIGYCIGEKLPQQNLTRLS